MPKDTQTETTLRVSVGQYASAGQKAGNQDFHGALIPTGSALALKGITLAVADGISSSIVSAEAAEIAVKSLMTDYYATSDAWTAKTAATQVIAATNAWLYGQNKALSDINAGRVCTLSALILKGRTAHIFHVGDSRVQRLAGTSLEPLTEDHRVTLSPEKSYLARALGTEVSVKVDYRKLPVRSGDIFILSTDGVHEVINGPDVADALRASPDLNTAAKHIADLALIRGSTDNLTVQILRVDGLPATAPAWQDDGTDLPIPSLPKDGDSIDGFRIIRTIHATARSHVFLATTTDGQKVALKIPASETAADPSYLQRFMLEEWIARRVSSPHILRAAKSPSKRTALYTVTEYIHGTTLRQWMTDHPAPTLDQVRDIISQIATGLQAFHRREMIHQDLRPENVIIDNDGTVKIIDFGSASVAGVEEAAPGTLGPMPGTFQYTAPEYLSGDPVSWRSDQFALAVIAYEMLTGRLPYGAQVARISSRRDQLRLQYQPAHDPTNGVPAWMDAALRRALHPMGIRRYDALTEFVGDLKRPGSTWRQIEHVPLIDRNPLRFWQWTSALLGLLCLTLILQLAN